MGVEQAHKRIAAETKVRLRRDELLSRHTTYRIGGPAALFIEPTQISELTSVLRVLAEENVESMILGRGSNVLASDEGYEGAIIVLGEGFRKQHMIDDVRIVAGAGMSLPTLVRNAFSKGLTGFEFAVGVPGTLGGALVGNVGTRDEWMGRIVESVTVLTPKHELVRLLQGDISWQYRSSDLAQKGIVVEACLRLSQGDTQKARINMEARLNRRKKSQPLSLPNAGSVFKNPQGESAGQLIESCGLKGERIGGAQISPIHANFIVNVDNARAADVVELIALARARVKEEHNIELRPEIKFIGAF